MGDDYSDEPRSKFTGFIPGKLYEIADPAPLPESVRIVAEIAARLLELREEDPRKPVRLLSQLGRVYRISSSSLWIVCEILAANQAGGKSLAEIGEESFFSKQAIHQRQSRDLAKLREVMPEVAEAISTILGRTIATTTTPPPLLSGEEKRKN